jgi:hypothetical protein
MSDLEKVVNQLKETESLTLSDLRQLSLQDRDVLFDEIKKWCVYADGDATKLS